MKTILIVEDQEDVQKLLKVALNGSGWALLHALDAADGLKLARERTPDLVLLDIMMPGSMDGLGLLKTLRENAETARAKIIVISARAQHQDQEAAMKAGANAYVTKPFRLAELKSLIEKMLA
ncbi:MAG TPA: response regulator [Desulfuromonadales bacterium]|nr:response regulator [Desulfuromonadales bacterium]